MTRWCRVKLTRAMTAATGSAITDNILMYCSTVRRPPWDTSTSVSSIRRCPSDDVMSCWRHKCHGMTKLFLFGADSPPDHIFFLSDAVCHTGDIFHSDECMHLTQFLCTECLFPPWHDMTWHDAVCHYDDIMSYMRYTLGHPDEACFIMTNNCVLLTTCY